MSRRMCNNRQQELYLSCSYFAVDTQALAEFSVNNNYNALPGEVRERTRLAILNFIGNAIGANDNPKSRSVVDACKQIQDGNLPIIGSGKTAGLYGSTWANSALSHFLDFDDTHLKTIIHPSAPVIAPLLSVAMNDDKSGKDLLYTSAIGMETALRLGLSVDLDERFSDWHNTSLFGTASSALACSIMMGANSVQANAAFLQGMTVATGFLSNKGTGTKSFQVGRSATEGIFSAIAGMNGVTVSPKMPEAFGKSLSDQYEGDILAQNLGSEWHVLKNFLKPYACGVVMHPGIDAAVEMNSRGLKPEEIEKIDVHVNPIVMVLTSILEPKNELEAKFSITHTIARGLSHGHMFPDDFSGEAINDPLTLRFRKLIRIHESEEINRGQTLIEVFLKRGSRESSEINRGPESPSKVMSEGEVKVKFHHLSDPVIGEERANEVWNYFSDIDSRKGLSEAIQLFNR